MQPEDVRAGPGQRAVQVRAGRLPSARAAGEEPDVPAPGTPHATIGAPAAERATALTPVARQLGEDRRIPARETSRTHDERPGPAASTCAAADDGECPNGAA